jgi:hypothetical protein
MHDHILASCQAFVSGLLGEPFDEHWWLSENGVKSGIGESITGWYVSTEGEMLTLKWADLTPDDVMVKLYAIIGWGLMNGVTISTMIYTIMPPVPGHEGLKGRPGLIYVTDEREF